MRIFVVVAAVVSLFLLYRLARDLWAIDQAGRGVERDRGCPSSSRGKEGGTP